LSLISNLSFAIANLFLCRI